MAGSSTDSDVVLFDVVGSVGIVQLNRPPLNPMNRALYERLNSVAGEIANRDDVRAVVIRGSDRAFSVGADLKELAILAPDEASRWNTHLRSSFDAIAAAPKPVIAEVHGVALGGGTELVLCADFRFAAADAQFAFPEIDLGIMPGSGGTQRLVQAIGLSMAKDLIMSAGVSARLTIIPSVAHTAHPASMTADGSSSPMSSPAACGPSWACCHPAASARVRTSAQNSPPCTIRRPIPLKLTTQNGTLH
jgi:hypothetical protein